jgi:rRNA maturation RNase YbeY
MSIKPVFYTFKSVGISLAWVNRVIKSVRKVIKNCRSSQGELSVAIISDREMRLLNKRYRKQNKPTDVLSFPGSKQFGVDSEFGEVVIAWGVCRRQAKAHKHSLKKEFTILLIHGLLHLCGYDHQRSAPAVIMEDLERKVLADIYEKII